MATDVYSIIFQEILQITPRLISQYSSVQDQLLYLILIPHLVLLLFLVAFSKGIVGRVLGGAHPGFNYLFTIVGYIFVIVSGLYGSWLVPFMITWFYLGLIIAFGLFFLSIIFHPSRAAAGIKMFTEGGKIIGEKTVGRGKKIRAYQDQIDDLQAQIDSTRNQIRSGTLRGNALSYAKMQVTEMESQKAKLDSEMSRL